MSRKFSVALLSVLTITAVFAAFGSSSPVTAFVATDIPVANIDGTWSDPNTTSSTRCLETENTPGDETDNNKIHAGRVNSDNTVCYTEAPYNAAPHNGGAGFDEGSGFGFDGRNGPFNIQPSTPFLVGLFTHYNRRVATNTSFNSALVAVTLSIPGATPEDITYTYLVTLDETPNSPSSNSGSICPYPQSSFYGADYLAFNGGFSSVTYTYGTPYTHANVGGSPPSGIRADNWLCGDKIIGTLQNSAQQVFEYGGENYTLILLGSSSPNGTTLNAVNDNPTDVCGDYPGASDVNIGLESRELTETQGCIWAQIAAPTAVSMTEPLSVTPASATSAPLGAVAAMAGLIFVSLLLWKRQSAA